MRTEPRGRDDDQSIVNRPASFVATWLAHGWFGPWSGVCLCAARTAKAPAERRMMRQNQSKRRMWALSRLACQSTNSLQDEGRSPACSYSCCACALGLIWILVWIWTGVWVCWSGAHGMAWQGTLHGQVGDRDDWGRGTSDRRQERSVHCEKVATAGFKRSKSVCPSGGSLHYPTSGHWALGSSGCGVTLPCARLFFFLLMKGKDSDQTSPAKSRVSGCGGGGRSGDGRQVY